LVLLSTPAVLEWSGIRTWQSLWPSTLDDHLTADGGEQLDARRIDHSHLMFAREEGRDANVVERGAADDPVRAKLVLAHPAPQREALVCGSPERARPRIALDVQATLGGELVGHPGVVKNMAGLRSLRSVVDRVERKVRAREDIELQPRVLLPRTRVPRIRSGPEGAPEAKFLRLADPAVKMHVARLELRLLVHGNALVASVLNEQVNAVAPPRFVPIDGD